MATKTTTSAPVDAASLRLIQIDPRELRSADQIREDATPDEQLVESVRTLGILQPPTVTWNDQLEAYYIVFGHRRVGAAIMAELEQIPVIVRDADSMTGASIIEDQIVENERRAGITSRELARGWANLEGLFGVTPEEIAAAIAEKPERVRAGIRAVRSEKTHALLASTSALDLEQAAVLTEFDEHPKVQEQLAEVASTRPENFVWRVEEARMRIAKAEREAAFTAELEAAGIPVAKTDGYGSLKRGTAAIVQLADAETGEELTDEGHAACPGHAGRVTGWSLEEMRIEYVCVDFADHGHRYKNAAPRELTAQEKREQAEREARAEAIASNRAARRQWIHDLLPGKINQLPGVYEYMAAAVLDRGGYYYDDHRAPAQTLPLLDVMLDEGPTNAAWTQAYEDLRASKRVAPFRLMLATAFGIHESRLEGGHGPAYVITHYTALQRWGYVITDIDSEVLADAHEQIAQQDETDEAGE